MSKGINAIVVGLAAFILLVGSIWYVTVARQQDRIGIIVENRWGEVDAFESEIKTVITFVNKYDVEVKLLEVRYELFLNGKSLASASDDRDQVLKARTENRRSMELRFSTDFVYEWLRLHIGDGEESQAIFKGEATFKRGTQNLTVPFTSKAQWQTAIQTTTEKEIANCPQPEPEPCVESTSAQWLEDNEETVLSLQLRIHNPSDRDLIIGSRAARLGLAQRDVGSSEHHEEVVVPPGGQESVEFFIFLQPDELAEWWPLHVKGCERSAFDVTFDFEYELADGASFRPPPTSPPSPTTTSPTTSEPAPTTTSPSPTTTPPTTTEPSPTTTPTSETTPPTTNATAAVPAPPPAGMVFRVLMDLAPTQIQAGPDQVTWAFDLGEVKTRVVCRDE